MKILLTIIFLISTCQYLFAQCPGAKAEQYKRKLEAHNKKSSQEKSTLPGMTGQAYSQAAMYYAYKCMCENGYAKNSQGIIELVNMANASAEYFNSAKIPGESLLPMISNSMCKLKTNESVSNGIDNIQDISMPTVDMNSGLVVKDEYLNLLNAIAVDSENPHFKVLVEDINRNRNAMNIGRSFALELGANQKDIDYYNMTENIAQAISIGKFLFNSISNKQKDILSQEQENAKKLISNLSKELRFVYDEVKTVPTYYEFNANTLNEVQKIEQQIVDYEELTAVRRLVCLEYIISDEYWSDSYLIEKVKELENLKNNKGVGHILAQISKMSAPYKKENILHYVNAEEAFRLTNNKISLIKAKCYANTGNKKKADSLLATIDYDIKNIEACALLYQSMKDKNYFSAIKYYEQVKEYILSLDGKKTIRMVYDDINGVFYNNDYIERHDIAFLLGLGVVAYAQSGQLTQASEELKILSNFNYRASVVKDNLHKEIYYKSKMVEDVVKASYFTKTGDYINAENTLDSAIALNKKYMGVIDPYNLWINQVKLKLLISKNSFEEAEKLAQQMYTKMYVGQIDNSRLVDLLEYRYLLSYMKFKQGKMNSSLIALKILEKEHPNSPRILQLISDVYAEMGDTNNSNIYYDKYIEQVNET